MQNQSVLISGIGIAGATLAYWLGEHGFKPTLVERAAYPRTSGYVFSPTLCWNGFIVKRLGCVVEILQMYS
jgi:2-polyprenyl-6-methoxyphenol hydroxylase-like FAD-dependent oxidoreductase